MERINCKEINYNHHIIDLILIIWCIGIPRGNCILPRLYVECCKRHRVIHSSAGVFRVGFIQLKAS